MSYLLERSFFKRCQCQKFSAPKPPRLFVLLVKTMRKFSRGFQRSGKNGIAILYHNNVILARLPEKFMYLTRVNMRPPLVIFKRPYSVLLTTISGKLQHLFRDYCIGCRRNCYQEIIINKRKLLNGNRVFIRSVFHCGKGTKFSFVRLLASGNANHPLRVTAYKRQSFDEVSPVLCLYRIYYKSMH